MKVWNIPIESLEERYSKNWNEWFPREFKKLNVEFETIEGEFLTDKINIGSFLDVYSTNYFKASQLMVLIRKLYDKDGVKDVPPFFCDFWSPCLEMVMDIKQSNIKDGDVLFFHDLWFPGLEMLQYIRRGAGIDFKIVGILHAGTYDTYDFLSKKGMGTWGKNLEECWLDFIDMIFVATDFHKRLIVENRKVDPNKIYVTGLPIYFEDYPVINVKKENIVVFPHRLDSEKQPELFDEAKRVFNNSGWSFLKTKEEVSNKKEYYELLSKSKIAVSFAKQETWGIAQQEALIYGCIPLVPDRLSYREMYPDLFRYRNMVDFEKKLGGFLNNFDSMLLQKTFSLVRQELKSKGEQAIPNMVEILRGSYGE